MHVRQFNFTPSKETFVIFCAHVPFLQSGFSCLLHRKCQATITLFHHHIFLPFDIKTRHFLSRAGDRHGCKKYFFFRDNKRGRGISQHWPQRDSFFYIFAAPSVKCGEHISPRSSLSLCELMMRIGLHKLCNFSPPLARSLDRVQAKFPDTFLRRPPGIRRPGIRLYDSRATCVRLVLSTNAHSLAKK